MKKKAAIKPTCDYCYKPLEDEELENPYIGENDEPVCDDCWREKHQFLCPVCQGYHDEQPEGETFFFITSDAGKEQGMLPGIYRANRFPFFRGALGGLGPSYIEEDNVSLVSSSILHISSEGGEEIEADFICGGCVQAYIAVDAEIAALQ